MHYQPPKLERSKVCNAADTEQPWGLGFMLAFVYLPLSVMVLVIRAIMLYLGFKFIDLQVIDIFLLNATRDTLNLVAPLL